MSWCPWRPPLDAWNYKLSRPCFLGKGVWERPILLRVESSIAVALDARSDWMQRAMERWGWVLIALGLIGLGVTIAMVVKMPA